MKIGQTTHFGNMLQVKTKLGLSKIPNAGIGLFADEFISKGTMITDVQSKFSIVFTDEEIENMPETGRNFLTWYGYRPNTEDYIEAGKMRVSLDNDRFMNHSEQPNCYENGIGTFALEDIQKGEEITTNYNKVGCDMKTF